jgi:SHS2 domain-containing protein
MSEHELLPQGELLKRAIRWLGDRRGQPGGPPLQRLVEEAAMKFDLSPRQVEFLYANLGPSFPSRHSFEEHTGELRLELAAPTLEELFAEAGLALAHLMLGELLPPPPSAQGQEIEVAARDGGALLVEWINELIFRAESSKQVFTRFQVHQATRTGLRATAWGVEPKMLKTAVKAATLHRVSVEPAPLRTQASGAEGFCASVVLDV